MSSTSLFFLDILKYSLSGICVFFIAYLVIRPYLDQQLKLRLLDIKKDSQGTLLPLRLQAYERLILLVERINPVNLLLRTNTSGLALAEYQHILKAEIRNEFQHNTTQQLYVSGSAWSTVSKIKEDTLVLINNAAQSLSPDAPAIELSKVILNHLTSLENNPYESAAQVIRGDVQQLF
ncbi:hypothetical protein [Arcticibacter sp.]|jgi:hypothetical protein|uniref:DUF7935 family protein n=1 Tax=Arcticibacter sp. TaxID=1872630 RepID=UPI00388D07FB